MAANVLAQVLVMTAGLQPASQLNHHKAESRVSVLLKGNRPAQVELLHQLVHLLLGGVQIPFALHHFIFGLRYRPVIHRHRHVDVQAVLYEYVASSNSKREM